MNLKVVRGLLYLTAAAAAAFLVWPWVPAVEYAIKSKIMPTKFTSFASHQAKTEGHTNRLIIPRIGVNSEIIEGQDLSVLDHHEGVWHQTGDLTNGNLVLAGHRFRYLPPNTTTFYNLDKLAAGDSIIVDWLGKRYVYVITKTSTVQSTDLSVLQQDKGPHLTVYTCNEASQSHRVVAIAEPIP